MTVCCLSLRISWLAHKEGCSTVEDWICMPALAGDCLYTDKVVKRPICHSFDENSCQISDLLQKTIGELMIQVFWNFSPTILKKKAQMLSCHILLCPFIS